MCCSLVAFVVAFQILCLLGRLAAVVDDEIIIETEHGSVDCFNSKCVGVLFSTPPCSTAYFQFNNAGAVHFVDSMSHVVFLACVCVCVL